MDSALFNRRNFLGMAALAAAGCHRAAAAEASRAAIRFGVCASPDQIQTLHRVGYDYLEMGLSSVAAMDAGAFEALCRQLEATPLKVGAFNGMLPGDLRITGDQVDKAAQADYLKGAFARAGRLGARVVVFGSGRSRGVPEGFPRERALDQLVDFLRLASEAARPHGFVIAIEPLRTEETNIINTVREGLALARRVDRSNVRVLADFYHMASVKEDPDAIVEAGDWLVHAHIACKEGRVWPRPDQPDDFKGFFDALRKIGYRGGVSLEGKYDDFERDSRVSLELMRSLARNPA